MIAHLSGTLIDKDFGRAVVDAGGVGYEVTIPLSTYSALGDPGSRVELHVHTHVREDLIALFGFVTRQEKHLFARLIEVNGVGPKTAIAALSGLGPEELIDAVRQRDAKRLASIPGIGRKTADRILLEVAEKIEALASEAPDGKATTVAGSARQDLFSALLNLGYNARAASEAVDRALPGGSGPLPPFEILLRQTLRILSR
jgi:Holliday junction DNA helicase RuvA